MGTPRKPPLCKGRVGRGCDIEKRTTNNPSVSCADSSLYTREPFRYARFSDITVVFSIRLNFLQSHKQFR